MPKTEPFDKYSEEYEQWFTKNADFYEAEVAALRRLLPSPCLKGMEVGIGTGKFALPLGIRIGVEPSEQMASKARTHGLQVYPGVAEALPFFDAIFDYVLMVTTLCFVDDVAKSFKEAHRVVKDGGFCLVGFVDRQSELGRQYSAKKEESRFYREANFFSTQEVLTSLKKAGFAIANIVQTLIPGELPGTLLENFGRGSFVAIQGVKACVSASPAANAASFARI